MPRKFFSIVLAISFAAAAGLIFFSRKLSARSVLAEKSEEVRTITSQQMPKMDGAHLVAKVVEVSYGPGGSSAAHSHPCPVLAVVTQGAIRTQVKGEPEAVYHAGQSFYELPNGIHQISANADAHHPAKLIAFILCDHETPETVPLPKPREISEPRSTGR